MEYKKPITINQKIDIIKQMFNIIRKKYKNNMVDAHYANSYCEVLLSIKEDYELAKQRGQESLFEGIKHES